MLRGFGVGERISIKISVGIGIAVLVTSKVTGESFLLDHHRFGVSLVTRTRDISAALILILIHIL